MNELNNILQLSGVDEAKLVDLITLKENSTLSDINEQFINTLLNSIIPNLEKEQNEMVNFLFVSKKDNIILLQKNDKKVAIAVCSSLDNLGLLKLSLKKFISK